MEKIIERVVGIIMMGLSVFWIYHHLNLYYYYHYTDLLFGFRLPDWTIYCEIFLGLINVYKSIKLFRLKISVKNALIFFSVSILIGILIQINYLMF